MERQKLQGEDTEEGRRGRMRVLDVGVGVGLVNEGYGNVIDREIDRYSARARNQY